MISVSEEREATALFVTHPELHPQLQQLHLPLVSPLDLPVQLKLHQLDQHVLE